MHFWLRHILILFLLILNVSASFAQENLVEVFHREAENGVQFFVKNKNQFPVTVELDLELENLIADHKLPATTVISAFSTEIILKLKPKEQDKAWNYRSKYRYYMGDINARHNDAYSYHLPFESGSSFLVMQGYGGEFSHKGELQYAMDFDMPEGTPVHAARAGTVVKLEEKNAKGGPTKEMMDFANYVTIMHGDGTFADYSHLKKGGVAVEVGQRVQTGQLIGYSGNTGFSTGPHLHFIVKKAKRGGGFISIPVKFVTVKGIELLKAGQRYTGY